MCVYTHVTIHDYTYIYIYIYICISLSLSLYIYIDRCDRSNLAYIILCYSMLYYSIVCDGMICLNNLYVEAIIRASGVFVRLLSHVSCRVSLSHPSNDVGVSYITLCAYTYIHTHIHMYIRIYIYIYIQDSRVSISDFFQIGSASLYGVACRGTQRYAGVFRTCRGKRGQAGICGGMEGVEVCIGIRL